MTKDNNFTPLKTVGKKVAEGTKEAVSKAKYIFVDEYNDNVEAFKVFINKFKQEPVPEDEFRKALEQVFKDNTKLLIVTGIGFLPGSAITLPIAITVAKKFGIELIPSKTFN